ncbi:MAG: AI-2E family transporter [Gammaproteobacteria bacterium]|nr:AI-2E family transporter [Gammaproteobacteria bacterium]NNM01811.1 AI-2E family transporter [Gammaproteobacteria bacterium]
MSDSQKWLYLVGAALTIWVLYLLKPVLTPFLIAAALAYLGDPLVDRLETMRLSRTLGVVAVFGVMLTAGVVALVILVPVLERQVEVFIDNVPDAIRLARDSLVPRLSILERWGIDFDAEALRGRLTEEWQQLGGFATRVLSEVTRSGQWLLSWLAYLVLIPVVTFYLLRDWDVMVRKVHDLLPRRIEAQAALIAGECDAVLSEFMRGQLTVMLALALVYTVGLMLVGLDVAILVGILAGLVSFVPYLGVVVGIVAAGIAAFFQFHDVIHMVGVAAVFGVGQALEGMVLSPLLVGDRIGLHPVAVIFAVMAGGQLFGFVGVLLALPVAAVVVVVLRHVHQGYIDSSLYSP